MKKRVLITEAGGFSGHHLIAAALIRRNSGVMAVAKKDNSIQAAEEFDLSCTSLDFGDVNLPCAGIENDLAVYPVIPDGLISFTGKSEQQTSLIYGKDSAGIIVKALCPDVTNIQDKMSDGQAYALSAPMTGVKKTLNKRKKVPINKWL